MVKGQCSVVLYDEASTALYGIECWVVKKREEKKMWDAELCMLW